MKRSLIACACAMAFVGVPARAQVPLGTAFTYQGDLQDAGAPVAGTYTITFSPAFTGTPSVVVMGPGGVDGRVMSYGAITSTSATIYARDRTTGVLASSIFMFIAIGPD